MTERTIVKQSRLDDDAISLTSTVSEKYDSDDEFKVDRILAEKTQGGRKIYLISWEGYPMEKSTWEPQKNIQDDEILSIWKERKLRESKGLDPPFNMAEFNALLARLAAEKAQRHRRRKAKRKQLGMGVSASQSENEHADDSDSSIEAIEESELDDDPGMKTKTKKKTKLPSKKQTKAAKRVNGRREASAPDIDAARKPQEKRALSMSSRLSPEKAQPPSRQDSVVRFRNLFFYSILIVDTYPRFQLSDDIAELQTFADAITVLFRCTTSI
jgi:chromo domain-containing protein 1